MTNINRKLKKVLSVILAITIVLGALPLVTMIASADEIGPVADPSTAMSYKDMLGTDKDGNRYAGRVWVDKSVYTDEKVSLDGFEITNDSDFLITYSALGSSTSVTTEKTGTAKLDVVLVLDNSSSMRDNNKMSNMVTEANKLIAEMVGNDADNRIAVVSYMGEPYTIAGLNHYNTLSLDLGRNNGVITAKGTAGDKATGALKLGSSKSWNNGLSGTYTQTGIATGMQILLDNADKSRVPVVVVLTDGEANIASTGAWYDIYGRNASTHRIGEITEAVVLSTILTGSYMKSAIENAYGRNAMVYGISVGLGNENDAYVVMDPEKYFNSTGSLALGRNAYSWFNEWKNSNSVITKYEQSGWSRYTWEFDQLPQNDKYGVTKQQVIDNINYIDEHYKVGTDNTSLGEAFQTILETITTPAFNPITDTVVQGDTTSEVPLTYVDFIGEYMEVKDLKAVTLFGKKYNVNKGSTVESFDASGDVIVRTSVTTYTVGANDTVTHPVFGSIFNISKAIRIELTDVSDQIYENGTFVKSSVSKQTLRIFIESEALPAIVDNVKIDVNGNVTFTEVEAEPVRVYYTVGVSDDIMVDGKIDVSLVSTEYIANNTVDGKVQFYSNRFGEINTAEGGVVTNGDAHVSFTPSAENRYYYYKNSFAVFSNVTDANGNPLAMDPEKFGTEHDESYNYTFLSAADVFEWDNGTLKFRSDLTDSKVLYNYIEYYRPTYDVDTTNTGAGELVYLLANTTWGELKGSLTAVHLTSYDSTADEWKYEYAKDDMTKMSLDELKAYIEGLGANYDLTRVRARLAVASERVTRLQHMVEKKTENITGTAINSYVPGYNTDATHVGGIVVWLGNNGTVSVAAEVGIEISKTVTEVAEGDTAGEYTFTVTSSANADKGKTAKARFYDAKGNLTDSTVKFNSNGVATVTLKADEKVQIIDLVAGAAYTVAEAEHKLYNVNVDSYTLVPQVGALQTAAFVNTPKKFGNVTINKMVTHDFGAEYVIPDIEFQIQLTFRDPDGNLMVNETDFTAKLTDTIKNITTDINVSTDANGKFTTTLEHGEQIEIYGLEEGTTITGMELYNGAEYSEGAAWYPGFSAPRKWHDDNNDTDNQVTIHANQTVTAGFVNDYTADKADVNIKISGTKTFDGDWTSVADDRAFNVYLEQYIPATATAEGYWKRIAADKVSKADPTYDFTDAIKGVEFAAAGDYLFQIYEENHGTTVGGVTFDGTVHTFGVSVADVDMTDGKLEITDVISYHTNKSFAKDADNDYQVAAGFTNLYSTTKASATFNVQKYLENKVNSVKVNASGFTFVLTEVESDWSVKNGAEVITSEPTDLAGETAFTITYTQDGTYYYILKEAIPDDKIRGMEYDENTEYRVKVVVHDDGNGNLTADAPVITKANGDKVNGVPSFTNVYNPEKATVKFDVNKVLNGRPLADGEFEFTIEEVNVSRVEQKVVLPKVKASNVGGIVDFGEITFNEVGTYFFEIKETKGNLPGVTYDEKVYHIRVNVTDNLAEGKLDAEVTVFDNVGEKIVFTNTYAAKSTEFTIFTGKDLIGRDLVEGEFTFALEEMGGDGVVRYATNKANGEVEFGKIKYTKAGTHTYKIYENKGADNIGITWDERVYTIVVVVTDVNENGEYTGQLKAQIDIDNMTEATAGKVTHTGFENKYEATATVTLNGMKYVNGAELNDTYTFVLYDSVDGVIKGSELKTAQNDASGKFSFALDFDIEDVKNTHYFIVEEKDAGKFNVDGQGAGIKNDTRYYTVKVTLADNGDGTLAPTVTMTRDNGQSYDVLAFVNTFYNITEKEVVSVTEPNVNIDGKSVSVGEILEYTINYLNGYEEAMDVTITDTIPAGTELVAGTAGDGVVNGNTVTWKFTVQPGEEKVVSFRVKVVAGGATITNKANVVDEYNSYTTNETENYTFEKAVSDTNGTANIEDKLGYSIQYTNNTDAPANVVITDTLDKGLTYVSGSASDDGVLNNGVLTWTFENVQPGETVTVTFDAIVNHDAGAKIDNTVSIFENGVEFKTNTVTTDVLTPVLQYQKSQSVGSSANTTESAKAQIDDEITYFITVTNTGLGAAKDITVADAFPAGLTVLTETISDRGAYANGVITWNIAELAAGQSITVSFKVIVNDDVGDVIKNVAIVTDDGEDKPTNEVETDILEPALEVIKTQAVGNGTATDGKIGAEVGDEITYFITVKNTGAGAANSVKVTDTVPAGVSVISGSVSDNGSFNNGVITWNIDKISAGAEITVSFKVVVVDTAGETLKNIAIVTDDGEDEPSNEVETDVLRPEIDSLKTQEVNDGIKSFNILQADIGDKITYYITVKNIGDGTAKEITVKDAVPAGIQLIDGSITEGGVLEDGVITWNIAELTADSGVTLSFSGTVLVIAGEEIRNVATVTDDGEDKPTNEVTTEVLRPDVEATKTQAVGEGNATSDSKVAKVGDIVTYYMTVKNVGDGVAKNITVEDTVSEKLADSVKSIGNNGVMTNGTITWTIDSIEAGEEVTVSFTVEIPEVADNSVLKNTAVVVGDTDGDGDPDEDPTNEVEIKVEHPDIPETGDSSQMMMWGLFLILSAAGFVAINIFGKRKETRE